MGIAIEENGDFIVTDFNGQRIIRVNGMDGGQTVLAQGLSPFVRSPAGVAIVPEPARMVLDAAAIASLAFLAWRRITV